MPIVTMPDGANVQFPDTMPPEQIKGLIARKFPQATTQPVPQEPAIPQENGILRGVQRTGRSFATGLAGIGDLGRVVLNPLYAGFGYAADTAGFPETGAEATRLSQAPMPSQVVKQSIDNLTGNRLQPQNAIERFGDQGVEFTGSALSMNPIAASNAALRPLATKTGGEVAGLMGAAGGLQGARELDVGPEGEVGLSVLGAIAGNKAVKAGAVGAAKASVPAVDEGLADTVRLAKKFNIPVSLDQATDSKALKNIQKVSQEIPFSGQKAFRDKQLTRWNKEILRTTGSPANKFTPAVMNEAFRKVGQEFDALGRGKSFDLKETFEPQIQQILDDAAMTSSEDAVTNFQRAVETIRGNAKGANGSITGEKLSAQRARINALARKTQNPETKELLLDLENAIIETMAPEGSAANEAFRNAKYKYKNLIVVEPLAQKAKAGNISPALLSTRVAKIYGRAYTTGKAGDIGDLAKIGQDLLPELGGSDTFQKQLYAGALGGLGAGAYLAPALAAGAALKAAPALVLNRAFQSKFNRNPAMIDAALAKGVK